MAAFRAPSPVAPLPIRATPHPRNTVAVGAGINDSFRLSLAILLFLLVLPSAASADDLVPAGPIAVHPAAVRLTHLPTGIVVSCQNERSQHRNRDSAMRVLKARLYDLKMKEQQANLDRLGGEKKDIAFGSQIRSYVLHPYQMVKDHRTKEEVGDPSRVLDGDLDGFIKVYLMKKASGTLGQATPDED